MKEITLGRTSKVSIIDDIDFAEVSKHKWHVGASAYAYTNIGKEKLSLHRFLLKPKRNQICDHINGNPLDNRRSNLRICTSSQNMMNRKSTGRSISGFKGVKKNRNKWEAQIKVNGVHMYLGVFQDKESAAREYDKAAAKYHGEFAQLNFPI